MKKKRILAMILAVASCLSLAVSASAANTVNRKAADFKDYNAKSWYAEAVSAAVDNGLLYGKSSTIIDPNGDMTRAEMAAIINRSFGCYVKADISKYTDVAKSKWYYLKKPLKELVDSIVDELETMPEVAAYYAVWNGVRDTLDGYYKNRTRQHNPLSQQKEFRAIKNAIVQEAERLRQQMEQAQRTSEQESSQETTPPDVETSSDSSTGPTLADEKTSSVASHSARLPSEYLLNSTIRLFHQMGQIFRDNAAPPSNPMGIRIDSKRRKKLMQKRLAMGHKQDDHEQNYGQTLQ